jgi:hypothetical protein
MDKLEEILYERVADLANMKREKPKAKLIREKQAIRKARRDFLLAQDQMQMQTKALCRPLCEAIHERLPQELRDMIVRYLITENSATFLTDKDGKVSITNGLSTLQYAFEEEFTGAGLHAYIIYELMTQDARFHFRTHHELLDKVFKHYAANEYGNLDLASKMKRLSLVVTERHLKDRQAVLAHLEALTKLSKGAEVLFIIDTGYCTQAQAIRQVRRVLRMMFGLLEGLHKLGLHITVVISPIYSDSEVDHSRVNPLFLTYYVVSKAVLASHSLVLISESGSIQHRLSHTSPSL